MNKNSKQLICFISLFFIFFACKEGKFFGDTREILLAEDEDCYKISLRHFICCDTSNSREKTIEKRYKGDHRGFSLNDNDTARLHHEVRFKKLSLLPNNSNELKKNIFINSWCDSNDKLNTKIFDSRFTNLPQLEVTENNKILTFGTYVSSTNNLINYIKMFSSFTIIENKNDPYMALKGEIKVEEFPSAEAYIKDPKGNAIFIAISKCNGKPGTISNIKKVDFNFSIKTDEDGNFIEVKENDITYDIPSWNKKFENQRANTIEKI